MPASAANSSASHRPAVQADWNGVAAPANRKIIMSAGKKRVRYLHRQAISNSTKTRPPRTCALVKYPGRNTATNIIKPAAPTELAGTATRDKDLSTALLHRLQDPHKSRRARFGRIRLDAMVTVLAHLPPRVFIGQVFHGCCERSHVAG